MAEVKGSAFAFWCVVALLTILATPTATLAQFARECRTDANELKRTANGQGKRLAVKTNDGWQFLPAESDSAPPKVLNISGLCELCLAWEAPPYRDKKAQIVYASTQYRDNQQLLLYRNSWGEGIPGIRHLLGDWRREPGPSGVNPDLAFRQFHRDPTVDRNVAPWKDLYRWHVWTELWGADRKSYDFVSIAVNDLKLLPYGTERLLRSLIEFKFPTSSRVQFIVPLAVELVAMQ